MRPPFASDETPSSITTIHQKINMVLAGSLEQTAAIEELRKENAMLKDKLQEMNGEMQSLKKANHQAVGTHLFLRIPPNVSVSCLCMMGSYYEQQCIMYFIFLLGICEGLALKLQTRKSISSFLEVGS